MIKFFRKVRQKLLAESKLRQYLIYAVGEILLVVIGILIALQINNWNQKRLNEKDEILILNALQKEFLENKVRYSEVIDKQTGVVESCQSLIHCLERKDLNYKRDSIDRFIYFGALNYFRAEPITGTYQALMGSGELKTLKNEMLKSKLASFYAEIDQGFEDEVASMNLLDQLHHEFKSTGEPLLSNEMRKRFGFSMPRNEDVEYQNKILLELYQNPNILSPLFTKMSFENNRLNLQLKMLDYSDEILNLIESELKEKAQDN